MAFRDRDLVIANNSDGLDESSPDEDIRLTGIVKLFTLFQNIRFQSPAEPRGNISYVFTPHLMASQYGSEELQSVQNDDDVRASSGRPREALENMPLDDVANAMRSEDYGLPMESKRWHL